MARLRKVALAILVVLVLLLALAYRGDRSPDVIEAFLAKPPSKFVVVDGLRIHYRDRGTGPVVVLLHGSNSSLFTWEGWTTDLARDHRVVALDLPGHGLTGPDPQERYTAAAMAEVVDHFTAQLDLQHFSIAGNSMGGNIAAHYVLGHPNKVDHLILVDAAGLPREEPRPFAFRMYSMPILGTIARWCTPRFLIERSVREVYGDPDKVTKTKLDLFELMLLREGNREATRRRFSRVDPPLRADELATIHVPTLILWGGKDRWILPKYGERYRQQIPNARLAVLPALGHTPMEEDPAATVAIAREFLDAKSP